MEALGYEVFPDEPVRTLPFKEEQVAILPSTQFIMSMQAQKMHILRYLLRARKRIYCMD